MDLKKHDYSDLYDDKIIEFEAVPTFYDIQNHFSEMESSKKTFRYKDKFIEAKRKFTYKGNGKKMFQIKTNYLHIYFTENGNNTKFTRSRPYKKNDNAHVEQKNWTQVRHRSPRDRVVAPGSQTGQRSSCQVTDRRRSPLHHRAGVDQRDADRRHRLAGGQGRGGSLPGQ